MMMRPSWPVLFLVAMPLWASHHHKARHPAQLTKDDYVLRVSDQLNDAVVRIRSLADHESHLEPGSKAGFQLALRKLWQKERVVRVQLERIKRSKGDQWLVLRKTEDHEIISLNKYYHSVVGRYLIQRS